MRTGVGRLTNKQAQTGESAWHGVGMVGMHGYARGQARRLYLSFFEGFSWLIGRDVSNNKIGPFILRIVYLVL